MNFGFRLWELFFGAMLACMLVVWQPVPVTPLLVLQLSAVAVIALAIKDAEWAPALVAALLVCLFHASVQPVLPDPIGPFVVRWWPTP